MARTRILFLLDLRQSVSIGVMALLSSLFFSVEIITFLLSIATSTFSIGFRSDSTALRGRCCSTTKLASNHYIIGAIMW